jgi:Uma2 family endonuclease
MLALGRRARTVPHVALRPRRAAEQHMGMPAPQPFDPSRRWTAAEVRALMDETRHTPRYELIDGELLVSWDVDEERGVRNAPSPLHQRAVRMLLRLLDDYVDPRGLGEVLPSPADLELEPETIVQPDVFVVPSSAGPLRESWSVVRSLLLAVEVLSPSTARYDRVTKRRFFQRVGVPEYWIVDADVRVVERSRSDDERVELLDERLVWHPAGAAEPFTLDLPAFFARVHREA